LVAGLADLPVVEVGRNGVRLLDRALVSAGKLLSALLDVALEGVDLLRGPGLADAEAVVAGHTHLLGDEVVVTAGARVDHRRVGLPVALGRQAAPAHQRLRRALGDRALDLSRVALRALEGVDHGWTFLVLRPRHAGLPPQPYPFCTMFFTVTWRHWPLVQRSVSRVAERSAFTGAPHLVQRRSTVSSARCRGCR